MMLDPSKDFFQNTETDPEVFAEKLAKRICQSKTFSFALVHIYISYYINTSEYH